VRLPPNARVLIDVLSTRTEPSTHAPKLALYAAEGAPRPITDVVLTSASALDHGAWSARRRLPRQVTLVGLRIDMGESGQSIEVRARTPDGSIEPLLLIREFAQQWQTPYVLRRPVTLPAGSVIEAAARFESGQRHARIAVHLQAFEPAPVARRQPQSSPTPPTGDTHHQH
jgi:hypothetical protein